MSYDEYPDDNCILLSFHLVSGVALAGAGVLNLVNDTLPWKESLLDSPWPLGTSFCTGVMFDCQIQALTVHRREHFACS